MKYGFGLWEPRDATVGRKGPVHFWNDQGRWCVAKFWEVGILGETYSVAYALPPEESDDAMSPADLARAWDRGRSGDRFSILKRQRLRGVLQEPGHEVVGEDGGVLTIAHLTSGGIE